jgi:hypothetical protein
MKKSVMFSLLLAASFGAFAQNLQFSQALVLSNSLLTVPTGKVWKVTAVIGEEFRPSECVNWCTTSTHELKRLRCADNTDASRVFGYAVASVEINGNGMPFRVAGFSDGTRSGTYYGTCDCTGTASTSTTTRPYSCANMATDPNVLPIWLPEGTTFRTGGPNTFASVIEFNVTE